MARLRPFSFKVRPPSSRADPLEQILTSPFVYPLPTWSVAIQICVYTAACLYATVAILGITTAIWTRDKASTVLWVIVFFAFGWLYVILHFSLQLYAFIKVFTGQVGEWQVHCSRVTHVCLMADPSLAGRW